MPGTFPASLSGLWPREWAIFLRKYQNNFCCFQNVFNFLAANFLLAAGIFYFFRQFSFCFQVFHFIPIYNKEDFHYEHHYRHRPRLLRHQNSPLFIPGWADKLRRTRTLHPPRTLRVWRVLFCLWLRAAAYPAGQDRKRQLLPADAGSYRKRNPAARFAARMLGAHCGGSAADQLSGATNPSSKIICCEATSL